MRRFLFLVLLLIGSLIQAQDIVLSEEDSTKTATNHKFSLYVAPSLYVNQFVETGATFFGIHMGVDYKERLDVNVSYSKIIDNFSKQIIFPSRHRYDQSNFGAEIQYSFLQRRITPHLGVGFDYVESSWNPADDSNDTFTDYIQLYRIFIGANWIINKIFTFQINAGYNFAHSVDIIGLQADDYNGLMVGLLLKFRVLKF